jgi:peptidoglycan L-alanyl-D-glutamate endopeptidase CwlK
MARLIDLNAETYFLANEALAEMQAKSIPHVVTSTKRTEAEQAALYAQGRAKIEAVNELRKRACMPNITLAQNQNTVTNCDGVRKKSAHQSGDALDIVPLKGHYPVWPGPDDPRWLAIAEIMEKHGFDWGGRWKEFPDHPHYQRKKP